VDKNNERAPGAAGDDYAEILRTLGSYPQPAPTLPLTRREPQQPSAHAGQVEERPWVGAAPNGPPNGYRPGAVMSTGYNLTPPPEHTPGTGRRLTRRRLFAGVAAGATAVSMLTLTDAIDTPMELCRDFGSCSATMRLERLPPLQTSRAEFVATDKSIVEGIAKYKIGVNAVRQIVVPVRGADGKVIGTGTILGIGITPTVDQKKVATINAKYKNKTVNFVEYWSGMVNGTPRQREACREDMVNIVKVAQKYAAGLLANSSEATAGMLRDAENIYEKSPYTGVPNDPTKIDAHVFFAWTPDKDDPYYKTNKAPDKAHAKIANPTADNINTTFVSCLANDKSGK